MRKPRSRRIKDYLIPHRGNGYKPIIFTVGGVVAILLVLVLIQATYLFSTRVGFNSSTFLASVLPGVLTDLTNSDRAHAGVGALESDPLLAKAAQLKAEDMAAKGYFAHTAPDGKTPWYWLDQVKYAYSYAGENLAIDFTDSEQIEEAWMASPKHHANIVKPQYTRIGIGIAHGTFEGQETTFVVQFFAKPAEVSGKAVSATGSTKMFQRESATSAAGASSTNRVLGAEISPDTVSSFWVRVMASPLHTVTYVLAALVGLFSVLLVLAIVMHVRIQYIEIIAGGLLIISASLGLIFYNISTSTGDVPEGGESVLVESRQ